MASIPWQQMGDEDGDNDDFDDSMDLADAQLDDSADALDDASDQEDAAEPAPKRPRKEENITAPESKVKVRREHGNVNALPTAQELTRLKETESLFRSNVFSMQVQHIYMR